MDVPMGPANRHAFVKIELLNVLVLSANVSCSMPMDRKMLKYMFAIRESPFRK